MKSRKAILRSARALGSSLANAAVPRVDCCTDFGTWIVCMLALGSMGMAIYTMYVEASLIAYIAFSFPLFIGPWVMRQRMTIQWIETYQEEATKWRDLVGKMTMDHHVMIAEIGRLERQIKRMRPLELRLEQIVRRDRKDVEITRRLVTENGFYQKEIKKLQAANELEELFAMILESDKNGDDRVSDQEMDEFLDRVKVLAGNRGRMMDEDTVRGAFKSSMTRSGAPLLHVTSSLISDAPEDNAEPKNEQKLQKMPRSSTGKAAEPVASKSGWWQRMQESHYLLRTEDEIFRGIVGSLDSELGQV